MSVMLAAGKDLGVDVSQYKLETPTTELLGTATKMVRWSSI
jgi:hypothetical protein